MKLKFSRNNYRYKFTIELILILTIGVAIYFLFRHYDFFESFVLLLADYENLDIDELFFSAIFILTGLIVFSFRRFIEFKKELYLSSVAKLKLQREVRERKKVEKYLRSHEQRTKLVLELVKKLEHANSYDEILSAVIKSLKKVMGYETTWFYKITPDRKKAELIFSGIIPKNIKQNELNFIDISSDPYYTRIANCTEIDVVEDAMLDELTADNNYIKKLKFRTLVHIPLIMVDKFIGLLGTGSFGEQGVMIPTAEELELIKNISGHVAIALNRIHLQNERNKAKNALIESEEKYRVLIDQSADGFYLNENDKFVIVNNKFLELFSLTRDEIFSDEFTLLNYVHPKSLSYMIERKRKVKAGESVPSIYEFTALTKDKKEIELEASISYITYEGGKIKTQGILRDISKRKRIEAVQSTILLISEAANLSDNLDELLTSIHSILKTNMYAENFFVEIYNKKTDLYTSVYFADQFDTVDEKTLSLKGSLTDYVRRTEKAAIIDEKKHVELFDAGEADYVLKPSKAWMGAPLKTPSGVIGVIAVQNYEDPNSYSSENLDLLSLISDQIAIAIEKKKISDEKEKNRKFFETIIDTFANPLFVINLEQNKIVVANHAAKTQILDNDVIDWECYTSFTDKNVKCSCTVTSCSIIKLFKTKQSVTFEKTIKLEDELEKIYEVFAFPMFDESGNVVQIIENYVDITERKKVEKKLTELAVFPEANPNIVLRMNSNQVITYMNTSASLILGEIGISNDSIHQCLPENLDQLIDVMLAEGSSIQEVEVKYNEHYLSWSFYPVNGQDVIHCYGHNITQQVHQAEELNKLSMVATQSSNIIMITSLNGVVEYVNPYFTRVTGYDIDEVVGNKLSDLRSSNTKPEIYKDLWTTITNGMTWNGKIENIKKNGELFWESKTISPIYNDAGVITSYISIGNDITNELHIQRQLVESEKFSAIATLAAGVAHEFKNYLGGIIGNASFSLDEIESDDGLSLAKETLENIIDMGEKANDVAMSLLTFSKAKSEDYKKEDLKKIINQSIKLVEKEFETLGIEIAVYFDEVPLIEISLSKIQQLLLNLFINAKHAIGSGGVLTIALLDKGELVEVRIGDSGGGIEQDNIDKIFDPFFSTKGVWGEEEVTGTGMGLSICRNIARDHHGDLKVESLFGIGSVFTLSLPVTKLTESNLHKSKREKEQNIIFFTLNNSLVTQYHDDACKYNLRLLLVDNFDKVDKSIVNNTELVVCDAKFSAKLELYNMVEFCLKHKLQYVMVNCGTMEYQLSDLYDNALANYKDFPDFYTMMLDFETV